MLRKLTKNAGVGAAGPQLVTLHPKTQAPVTSLLILHLGSIAVVCPSLSWKKMRKSMAGPIVSYVSAVLHGVPVLMICGTKNAKKLNVSARRDLLISRLVNGWVGSMDIIMVWA